MSWEQVGQGLALAVPSTAVGVFAYLRSRKVDAISEQSGIVSDTRAGTAQIIDGLNGLIDNLQEDNKIFREDIKHLTARLDAITAERDELKRELARLRRKYGNGEDAR
jgi:ABC-type transporter Mla subunit MlaD